MTQPDASRRRLFAALTLGGLTTLAAALGGLTLFVAGSLLLNVDLGLRHAVNLALPGDLLARGPLGWAAWVALLGACGAPLLGAAVFAILYFGRNHAD